MPVVTVKSRPHTQRHIRNLRRCFLSTTSALPQFGHTTPSGQRSSTIRFSAVASTASACTVPVYPWGTFLSTMLAIVAKDLLGN